MKRREFLKNAIASAAAGSALVGCGNEQASSGPAVVSRDKIRWRLASSFPQSLDTLYGATEYVVERVAAMTNNAFEIRPYPAGELVPGLEVLDAVQQGTVQIGQSASYYYVGKNPALAFDTCVPFGMTARQKSAWLHQGGGLELMRELFSDYNVINFPAGNTGAQMGGWFNREISTLEDLKGLKMRIPGMGGKVMSKLGVSVQVIAGGEIYPALERGAIDATEWVGPYDDEKLGFHNVANYYYYPGWWEPGPSLSFYVNQTAWDNLPSDYQAILTAAFREAELMMTARYDARNPPAFKRLLASGVDIRPFSDEIMSKAQQEATELFEDYAAQDPGYRKVYDAWKVAKDDMVEWFGTAELAYAQFVSKQ